MEIIYDENVNYWDLDIYNSATDCGSCELFRYYRDEEPEVEEVEEIEKAA